MANLCIKLRQLDIEYLILMNNFFKLGGGGIDAWSSIFRSIVFWLAIVLLSLCIIVSLNLVFKCAAHSIHLWHPFLAFFNSVNLVYTWITSAKGMVTVVFAPFHPPPPSTHTHPLHTPTLYIHTLHLYLQGIPLLYILICHWGEI